MCARLHHLNHKEQKKVTRKGTLKSTTNPWKMETTTNCWPLHCVMIGKVVSMVVAPPDAIGARFPNHLTNKGAASRVKISRVIFDSNAMVPNSAPLYSVMKILERE